MFPRQSYNLSLPRIEMDACVLSQHTRARQYKRYPQYHPRSFTRQNLMVLLLAVAGGGVDAIIILAFQLLTGAQTGNTVMLAVALAEGRFAAGFYSAVSVASFIIGSVVGRLVILKRKSESALGPIGWALIAELVTLSVLIVCWHFAPHPGPKVTAFLAALAAGSMGMQSAAVLRLHGSATTTYVTGTLITFSTDLARWLFIKQTGEGYARRQDGLSTDTVSARLDRLHLWSTSQRIAILVF